MKELDNELDFLNGVEDMPDFDDVEIPEETTADEPESSETEDESTEEEESAESAEETPSEAEPLNPYANAILAEMKRRVEQGDELLATAMQSKDKSIQECCKYMEFRAKKYAEEQKLKGQVVVWMSDADGYAVAHHYYVEPKEVIDKEMQANTKAPKKPSKEAMKKIHSNPLLESLMNKKGFSPTEDGAVVKTTTMKGGTTKETKVEDKAKTITLKGKAGQLTITEFSLF